jgi:triosephosphate isomerase (TIM)
MNCTILEARTLANDIRNGLPAVPSADVLICPPFTALTAVSTVLRGSEIHVGGQNMYFEDRGAFTGEVSPLMLLDVGCRYVILGHSERRRQMGETSEMVNRKLKLALCAGLIPIVCVGETLLERSSGGTEKVIREQIEVSFCDVAADALPSLLIAYEPVWAIGTGHVAPPDQAAEVHCFVRGLLPASAADKVRILYGGSVTPENVAGLLEKQDLDGALVGGASLKAESFAAIVQAAA